MTEVEYGVSIALKQPGAGTTTTQYYEPDTVKAKVVVGKNPVKSTCGSKTGVN